MNRQSPTHYLSLRTSISLGMTAVALLASGIIGVFYYHDISSQVREATKLRLAELLDVVALQLDPQALEKIGDEKDVNDPVYVQYQKELTDIIKANGEITYIYTMQKDEKGTIYFYLDTGDESYTPDPPGAVPYEQPSDLLLATFASPSGTVVENDFYVDEFGTYISAYKPIFKSDGSLQSVLAIDMKADTAKAIEQNALRSIWIYLGISVPMIILLSWIFGYLLSRPSIALTAVANRIARMTEYGAEPLPSSAARNSREAFELIQVFNRMSGEIHNLIQTLEQRVAERTADLEIANRKNLRRAEQFEAITEIAQAATTVQEIELLLPRLAQLISTHFGHYHAGIFLLDANREYAVLRGTSSPGGQKMIKQQYRLRVGHDSLVGLVAATGSPRIALDVGRDAVHFDNPDLPDTHSEIALPMIYARHVIGVLDVQSSEQNAFSSDDITVLSTLAAQITVAIQNVRSLEETRKSLVEAQSAVSRSITEAWRVLQTRVEAVGYQSSGASIQPLQKPLEDEHVQKAIEKRQTISTANSLAIPIRLRNEIIGVINLRAADGNSWSSDQVDIAEAIAARLSLAIETSTLIHASQRRANIERITADITGRISSSTHLETILQTAAQELSRALGGSDVLVQIEPAALKLSSSS